MFLYSLLALEQMKSTSESRKKISNFMRPPFCFMVANKVIFVFESVSSSFDARQRGRHRHQQINTLVQDKKTLPESDVIPYALYCDEADCIDLTCMFYSWYKVGPSGFAAK